MYLKQMELLGFKSFANKIVLKFHNGITGIVGPNGSGKSNVADAVRWVLGEQSAKTLRSGSMTDVIFSGTEQRKPLSYAYVAITFDNSDHVLPTDYEEVTVARRVYRSGESEYLINGSTVRLKDVNELFMDTGIGKEGYSIIGQGQIDKILSGKSEERRELFDEAVGIVKYKKRKAESIKKLNEEEDSLVRLEDILSELERQQGPLKEQAETAREYLKKRDRLKTLDINAFLLETASLSSDDEKIKSDQDVTKSQLDDFYKKSDEIKNSFHQIKEDIAAKENELDALREKKQQADVENEKREGQIKLLNEQLKYEKQTAEELEQRRKDTLETLEAHKADKAKAEEDLKELNGETASVNDEEKETERLLANAKRSASELEEDIAKVNKASDEVASFKSEHEALVLKNKALKEQLSLQKSQTAARLLSRKEKNSDLDGQIEQATKDNEALDSQLKLTTDELNKLAEKKQQIETERDSLKNELKEKNQQYSVYHTRLESIRNIAERYEGFGNTVKRVMEKKSQYPGIYGVVADLVSTEKKYEVAIEIALGGSVKNVVVDTENTAKELISYLKRERLGRATFLPVSSVKGSYSRIPDGVSSERGVIGTADTLVRHDSRYDGIFSYLLGRTVVVDSIDDAIALERKYHQSLNLVTLEGDTMRPGGAMTGGAYRRSENLLGRKRQLDELSDTCKKLQERLKEINSSMDESSRQREEAASSEKEKRDEYNRILIEKKNKEHDLSLLNEQKADEARAYEDIVKEEAEIKKKLAAMEEEQRSFDEKLSEIHLKESDIATKSEELEKEKVRLDGSITRLSDKLSDIRVRKASLSEKLNAASERLGRFKESEANAEKLIEDLKNRTESGSRETEDKKKEIEDLKAEIENRKAEKDALVTQIKELAASKEELDTKSQSIFDQSESISSEISVLEKESLRLEQRAEKNKERFDELTNYMWDQYEITKHEAEEQKDETLTDLTEIRKESKGLQSDIRQMGSVNVNAVEEYDELSKRYTFMNTQHDDLLDAKEKLLKIINDLDTGMRAQFETGFADIQKEFDKAFKELFGGGHGKITLAEDEDILEADINIIASPPGKKLTNMMQMSGGEKSLTAIALLFAIQNLHPSPFCLLDEIEAALDDSNVDRFAQYLNRLTNHTQFIVITHRRGTMNAADRLYGITMQEKGVSTLVSVNLIEDQLK